MRVGFAGAGNMAGAIARGWAAGDGGPDSMLFCDLDAGRAEALARETGGETRPDLGALGADSDAVVLAVKPAALDDAAAGLGADSPPVISVLAATPVARLREALPGAALLRVMPNQPVEVRAGVLCYAEPDGETADRVEGLLALLAVLGRLVPLAEDDLEAAMAVMSCSPAYVAHFAGELAGAGVREGLAAEVSDAIVADTLEGTAKLLRKRDPQAIIAAVAPRGGATEAGLEALAAGGFATSIDAAVRASLERFR
jgi:pyrroline-5-carboxylate reductase